MSVRYQCQWKYSGKYTVVIFLEVFLERAFFYYTHGCETIHLIYTDAFFI